MSGFAWMVWFLWLGVSPAFAEPIPDPVPSPDPVRVSTVEPLTKGLCDRDDIAAVVRSAGQDLHACYEMRLEELPELGGRITVQFLIGQRGRVDRCGIAEADLIDIALQECVSNVVLELEFLEPRERGLCWVRWPFVFSVEEASEEA